MMRVLPFGILLLLAACAQLDTSAGSSGVPDIPFGQPGFERGSQTISGQTILNRELAPRR